MTLWGAFQPYQAFCDLVTVMKLLGVYKAVAPWSSLFRAPLGSSRFPPWLFVRETVSSLDSLLRIHAPLRWTLLWAVLLAKLFPSSISATRDVCAFYIGKSVVQCRNKPDSHAPEACPSHDLPCGLLSFWPHDRCTLGCSGWRMESIVTSFILQPGG